MECQAAALRTLLVNLNWCFFCFFMLCRLAYWGGDHLMGLIRIGGNRESISPESDTIGPKIYLHCKLIYYN
jgi:hypothetical protein